MPKCETSRKFINFEPTCSTLTQKGRHDAAVKSTAVRNFAKAPKNVTQSLQRCHIRWKLVMSRFIKWHRCFRGDVFSDVIPCWMSGSRHFESHCDFSKRQSLFTVRHAVILQKTNTAVRSWNVARSQGTGEECIMRSFMIFLLTNYSVNQEEWDGKDVRRRLHVLFGLVKGNEGYQRPWTLGCVPRDRTGTCRKHPITSAPPQHVG